MIAGIDLAASPTRPTGVAVGEDIRVSYAGEIFADEEIFEIVKGYSVNLCAIDAPLTTDENRIADKILKKYGAMPLKIPAMKKLAERGVKLKYAFEKMGIEVIEVFPTATAKILGIYRKKKVEMLPELNKILALPEINKISPHIIDALLSYYTAYLYLRGKYKLIEGSVVVPYQGDNEQ